MKCTLDVEREVVEFYPGTTNPLAPDWLVKQCVRREGRLFAPPGTVYDDPSCYLLVLNGVATPADDECRAKDTRTPEQKAAAQVALKRLQLGIHPDDFEAYAAGKMIGYDKDGKPIPGPNAKPESGEEEE